VESNSDQLPFPVGVYGICDAGLAPARSLTDKAGRLLEGGVRVLQLRMKGLSDREALAVARDAVELCHRVRAQCLINDRVDLALLSGADGVHLGNDDLPPHAARKVLGPAAIIGATCRSLADVLRARESGANYAGLGPIFPTRTKRVDADLLGLAGLARVAAESPLPVVAISGIGLQNIAQVAACGAHAAAIASDLLLAPDIAERARLLAAAFAQGRRSIAA
jgi:thiamine-phosphate pyrophosphorylase